jgi:hypothetical protein
LHVWFSGAPQKVIDVIAKQNPDLNSDSTDQIFLDTNHTIDI